MRLPKALAPIALAAALLAAPLAASAGLVAEISSGAQVVTIYDNGANDGVGLSTTPINYAATLGLLGYAGAVGTWEVSMAFASGYSDPLAMHLTSVVGGTSGDQSLTIKLTYTDLTASAVPSVFSAFGGGAGAIGATGGWSAYVDDTNTLFGTQVLVGSSNGFGTGAGSVMPTLDGTYSATIVSRFDYSNAVTPWVPWVGYVAPVFSSLDVNLNVPEPASLALVGLGLLGIGASRRRKA